MDKKSQKPQLTKPETTFKEFIVEEGDLTLDDIVGQDKAIAKLKELIDAIKYNEIYGMWQNPVPKGYLLIGPTGVGKTASVRALAASLVDEIYLFELKYSDVESKFIGAQVELLRDFFDMVEEKSKEKHVILFVDEIDSMIPSRDSSHMQERTLERINLWLEWMGGGFSSLENVTILGATNNPDGMDSAARRSGRFDLKIKFVELNIEAIVKGLKYYINKRNLKSYQINNINYNKIKEILKPGMLNGADLPEIVNRVIRKKITEHIAKLNNQGYKQLMPEKRKELLQVKTYYPSPISTNDIITTILDIKKDGLIHDEKSFGFTMDRATAV